MAPVKARADESRGPAKEAEASLEKREDERERRIEVRTPNAEVAFTNRGGRVVSWKIARGREGEHRQEEMVQAAPGGAKPLDLETGDAGVDETLRTALFLASGDGLTAQASGESLLVVEAGREGTVVFEYASGALEARKELTFRGTGELVTLSVTVKRGGEAVSKRVLWGPGIGNPTVAERGVQGYQTAHGVALVRGAVERVASEKLQAAKRVEGATWAGIESQYFAALLIPPQPGAVEFRPTELAGDVEGEKHKTATASMDLGTSVEPALLYVGAKDYHSLTKIGHGLAAVVPVGEWIGPIVVPLMLLLRWVEAHIGNYGLAIILLTVVINVVMAPLRHYSIANGLKMAKISPEMRVIQERYRKIPLTDPRRQGMQEEMGALYAKHGMNMGTQFLVGCLPILITMPFLIAFYRVLTVSVDLRGAGFLWMSDLSLKDPIYAMPVLMGVSMFLMQKMMPSTMDPAQQKMMMLMPLVLAGMFLWAPAGLNLYWLASNACAITQQGVTLSVLNKREDVSAKERKKR